MRGTRGSTIVPLFEDLGAGVGGAFKGRLSNDRGALWATSQPSTGASAHQTGEPKNNQGINAARTR